jgi:hypothetical protein
VSAPSPPPVDTSLPPTTVPPPAAAPRTPASQRSTHYSSANPPGPTALDALPLAPLWLRPTPAAYAPAWRSRSDVADQQIRLRTRALAAAGAKSAHNAGRAVGSVDRPDSVPTVPPPPAGVDKLRPRHTVRCIGHAQSTPCLRPPPPLQRHPPGRSCQCPPPPSQTPPAARLASPVSTTVAAAPAPPPVPPSVGEDGAPTGDAGAAPSLAKSRGPPPL